MAIQKSKGIVRNGETAWPSLMPQEVQEMKEVMLQQLLAKVPPQLKNLVLLIPESAHLKPVGIDCEACFMDLAAFIDLEVAEGLNLAAEIYPDVWWHLLSCQDCAETYAMTWDLTTAEHAYQIVPPPPPSLQLRLTNFFLAFALPQPASALRSCPGVCENGKVIYEKANETCEATLFAKQQPTGEWIMLVKTKPTQQGYVVVTLGKEVFQTDLMQGQAVINLPASLAAPNGPDLLIEIFPRALTVSA